MLIGGVKTDLKNEKESSILCENRRVKRIKLTVENCKRFTHKLAVQIKNRYTFSTSFGSWKTNCPNWKGIDAAQVLKNLFTTFRSLSLFGSYRNFVLTNSLVASTISNQNKANRHKSRAPSVQRQTDRPTDRPTDRVAYRVACTRLINAHIWYAIAPRIGNEWFKEVRGRERESVQSMNPARKDGR